VSDMSVTKAWAKGAKVLQLLTQILSDEGLVPEKDIDILGNDWEAMRVMVRAYADTMLWPVSVNALSFFDIRDNLMIFTARRHLSMEEVQRSLDFYGCQHATEKEDIHGGYRVRHDDPVRIAIIDNGVPVVFDNCQRRIGRWSNANGLSPSVYLLARKKNRSLTLPVE